MGRRGWPSHHPTIKCILPDRTDDQTGGWLQHDERGSATALHICVRLSEHRFLFFFACLGDTEVISTAARSRHFLHPNRATVRSDASL